MQKPTLIIIAVLALAGVAGLGYIAATQEVAPQPSNQTVPSYTSAQYGFRFAYSAGYYLRENQNVGTAERPQLSVVLVEDTQENRDVLDGKAPEGREGPTSITVDAYQNPNQLSAKAWAEQDTNWNIGSKQTSPVTVGGIEGVSYTWDGLYPGKSAIVTRGRYAYVVSVTWMTPEDAILQAYDSLLKSFSFTQ